MELVGNSPAFLAVTQSLRRVARSNVPLLLRGETGTGKELVARVVHYQSARANRPFIPVNCGALPESLVENELFGHERGAYTDARDSAPGMVALAEGGTLFLDEIDALSPKAQVAFLRFLQDQRFRPLGASVDRYADVRIIAATNQDLSRLAATHRFRDDLLFRLNVLLIDLPPLRSRPGDAQLLAEYFLDECARRFKQPRKQLSAETIAWLQTYQWPGNIRELENFIMRECLMTEDTIVVYPKEEPPPASSSDRGGASYAAAKAHAVAEFDRRFLRDLLARVSGNVTRAAAEVGKDRRALGRLVKKYGLSPSEFRRQPRPD